MAECGNDGKEHDQVIVLGNAHERDKDGTDEQADTDADGETRVSESQPMTGWVNEEVML